MELELERTQLNGYSALLDTSLCQEETLEMIVPDACPDILRVVDTGGTALLRSREAMDGRAEVAGTVRAAVLYLPDGEEGLRRLDVAIPFTCAVEAPEVGPECRVVAQVRLRRADTRVLNPRKVLVRAEVVVDITVFSPILREVFGQVADAAEQGIEQLADTREVYATACVQEKPFSLSDEVVIPANKPAAGEVLRRRVCLNQGESKLIGNKLIFKGSVNISILYRGEDNGVYTAAGEAPFSQIMEVSGIGEGADCALTLALTGCSCDLAGEGEGRTLAVSLEVLAQAVVREPRTITVLTDAYSTREPVEARWETFSMDQRLDGGVRSQNAREAWELETPVQSVTDCGLALGQVLCRREGEKVILTAQAEVSVLYISTDGSLCAARRSVEVPCSLELEEGCACFCRCEEVGEVYATPVGGGVEVRFALDFHYCALASRAVTAVVELVPGETAQTAPGEQPTLVLRMLEGGERLWDVAKAYGTTIADIMSANELADQAEAAGRLLLIPRKR